MNKVRRGLVLVGLALGLGLSSGPAIAQTGSISSFALLAGSTITNSGVTTISGSIGLHPGTSLTGESTIVLTNGTYHITDGVAQQAKSDLVTAYNVLLGLTGNAIAGDLGGTTLQAGVYNFSSSAQLTGVLTLNGDADDVFVIQIGSTFTTATDSSILLTGGALARNVFFVAEDSVTLGTRTAFQGQILALNSITFDPQATIACGAAYARNAAITLINNSITICSFAVTPVVVGGELDDDASDAARRLAEAIDDFVTAGGVLPLSFALLALLSPADLALALEQLSGEIGSAAAPAGMQSVDSFMSSLRGPHSGPGTGPADAAPDTISVMGYSAVLEPGGSAFAEFDADTQMPDIATWTIWSAVYGGKSLTEGDSDAGTHDRTVVDYGMVVGFERPVDADTRFGFAVSAGGTSFSLDDDAGTGKSGVLQAAVTASRDFDNSYLSAILAYGVHDITTRRTIDVAGTDTFSAEFFSQDVSAELEAGYHMGWFTPYGAVRGTLFYTPAYSEETVAGNSTFALDYEEHTAAVLRTEIGARANWSRDFDGGAIGLNASAAWVHQYWAGDPQRASFQSVPGISFDVEGAHPVADSIVYAVGADVSYDNGVMVGASVGGSYAENALSYSGRARLAYSW